MHVEVTKLAEYVTKFMCLKMRMEKITLYNSDEKIDILKKKFVELVEESVGYQESSILR